MISTKPPAPVAVWRRFLWVALGAGTTIAAAAFARIITPDVPTYVDDDGFEYSEGGLFGNVLRRWPGLRPVGLS